MFIDRTLEENKLKDVLKRAIIKDLSIYWNSSEKHHNFITGDSYNDPHRKKFLLEYILRSDMKAADAEPILMISLESNLTFKNINTSKETDPRYKIDIDLKPITITVTSDQTNQIIALGDAFAAIEHARNNKYELPTYTEDELQKEANEYKEAMEKFLDNYEDSDFKWTDELENPKRKIESEEVKWYLSRLPNKTLIQVSKDIIIQYEKNKLLNRYEKKINKKGIMGYFYSSSDKNAAEDVQKMEAFFDSFIKQNADSIGTNLSKGFIMQLNVNLTESNLYLIHNKTQQGVLCAVKQLKTRFELLNTEVSDIANFLLNVGSAEFFFVQKYPGSQFMKRTPVLKKIKSIDYNRDLAIIGLTKTKTGRNEVIEIKLDVSETEFNFMPEFVIVLKKFFTFQKTAVDSKFTEIAYEKLADMQKNAQDQLKMLINEYSSTLSVSVMIAAVTVVIPLVPSLGQESDGWVISIGKLTVNSELDNEKKETKFNKFKKTMENINVKYYEKVAHFQALRLSSADPNNQPPLPFTLLNDTKFSVFLRLAENADVLPTEEPQTLVKVSIGKIGVNLNKLIYKKVLALGNCFDFSNEKEFSEYAETEKKSILKNSEGLFKIYYQDRYDIGHKWNQYIMVCSGFYLYFYETNKHVHYSKYVFLKGADIFIEKEKFDVPYVLRIKNKFEEVYIALESDDVLNRLIKIIERKNQKQLNHSMSIHFDDKEEDVMLEKDKEKVPPSMQEIKLDKIDNMMLVLNLFFEGLELILLDETLNITNSISMNHLTVTVNQRILDSDIAVKLKEISILDFKAIKEGQKSVMIMSSQCLAEEESSSHLISFTMITYDQRHPKFEQNHKLKEFSLIFNELELNWIPERIFALITFFSSSDEKRPEKPQERFEKLEKIEQNPEKAPKHVHHPPSLKAEANLVRDLQYITKKTEAKDYTFLEGNITVKQLSLVLVTRYTWIRLAQFKLNNLNMRMISDKRKSIYKGMLENIQCFDLTGYGQDGGPENKTPNELIGIEKGQSLLEFYFESREPLYVKEINTYPNIYNILSITCHSVRINYIQQPVMRVVNYVMNFILSFDYGITKTLEQRLFEAVALIKREGFTDITVKFEHPKIFLQSMPSSKVYFELDLGLISVKNKIEKNTSRILQPMPGINYVFTDTYNIQLTDAKLTKVINGTERSDLTSKFKFTLLFQRMPWFEDWVLYKDLEQSKKYEYFDNTFFLDGTLTPVLLKFDQEDFIDLMDFVSFNISNDDKKDLDYHLDEDVPATQISEPTPMHFTLVMEYLAFLADDQMIDFPLAKIAAAMSEFRYKKIRHIGTTMGFTVGKLAAAFYESGNNNKLIEKTLLGRNLVEREIVQHEQGNLIEDILNHDLHEYMKQKESLLKEKIPHFKLEMNTSLSGDKETLLNLQEIKIILVIGVLLRLKDFFTLPGGPEDESVQPNLANSDYYKTKSTTQLVIEKAEINLPSNSDSTLILRSKITLELDNFDVLDILKNKDDYLESSLMTLTLHKNEIFVFHNKSREKKNINYTKRSIIYPFSITYTTKEMLKKKKDQDSYLAKYEAGVFLDKIVIRASAVDSLILSSAINNFQEDMTQYQSWAKFPEYSPHTTRLNIVKNLVKEKDINFEAKQIKLEHSGFLIRFINDLYGYSVPILDFSIHEMVNKGPTQLIFSQDGPRFYGKNKFEISSSFFNPRVGMWEPILEKWPFLLELEFISGDDSKQKIDLATEEKSLNINISDELVQTLLTSYYDWTQNFKEPPKKNTTARDSILGNLNLMRTRTTTSMSKNLLQFLSIQEMNSEVEYVSPCTIWNDTGYPILVDPIVSGLNTKKTTGFDPRIQIDPGQEKQLLIEWSIDKIFDASTNQSVLDRLKVNVKIDFPSDSCDIFNIDLHNFGTKRSKINLIRMKKQFSIVCNVFNHMNKKLVRFSSPVVIKNSLSIPLYIKIYDAENPLEIIVKSHSSRAIPVDKIEHMISFHESQDFKDSTFPLFSANSLDKLDQTEVKLGLYNAVLRHHHFTCYDVIYVEPIIVIKNSLPFAVTADITGKIGMKTEKITKILETQETIQLLSFDSKYEVTMKMSTPKFGTNEFIVQPYSLKNHEDIYFIDDNQKVFLDLCVPIQHDSYTKQFIISAKACIINESYEQLTFYSYTETTLTPSNFSIYLNNGIECILFDNISFLKIGSKNIKDKLSEPINLQLLGTFNENIEDGSDKIYNLAIKVSQELAGIRII